MTLPKVSIPTFNLTIPSTKKKIKCRPYLVREEKVLLMAAEAGDLEDLLLACKQVVSNCCQDEIDVDKLAIFDLEYLFLKLAAQSASNVSKLAFLDNEDKKKYEFEVDLNAIELDIPEIDSKIKANGGTIVLKYPTMKMAQALTLAKTEGEMLDKLVVDCIDYIYDDENVYNDFTEQEILTWLDNQPTEVYDKLRVFLDKLPQLKHELHYTNSKGSERTITLSGISDFFPWL